MSKESEERIKTYFRQFTPAGRLASLERRALRVLDKERWEGEEDRPFRLKVMEDCISRGDSAGFWFNVSLFERSLDGMRIVNARQSKIDSGNDFRDKLFAAMKYWKDKHPRKFKWDSDNWLLDKFFKGAERWKSLTEEQKEEEWNENDPTFELIDLLSHKPRRRKTLLNNISLLRKSLS